MMIFSSLDPWSIIFTLTCACANAEKILPAVPRVWRIPRPTTAISARSDSSSISSGFTARWIPARTFCSCSSNSSWWTKMVIVSIPDGICSKEIPSSSNTPSTLRPNPTSEFIIAFSIVIEANPRFPAIPVIVYFGFLQVPSTIRVPFSSGAFVLRMLIGIPSLRTGKIASSCSPLAPI